jgi:hypothetical protein
MNRKKILSPNSEFERREELNSLREAALDDADHDILNQAVTGDLESIALIGILLKDNSLLNKARLLIGTRSMSVPELRIECELLLGDIDREALLKEIAFVYTTQALTEVEEVVYFEVSHLISDI